MTFGAVATEIGSGHEVWLRKGDLVQAIRASYALPGIFEPLRIDSRWLFDGALVNPVPVTLCRALGAELVIAVNLVGDTAYRGALIAEPPQCGGAASSIRRPRRRSGGRPRRANCAASSGAAPMERRESRRLCSTPSTSPRTASRARVSPAIPRRADQRQIVENRLCSNSIAPKN